MPSKKVFFCYNIKILEMAIENCHKCDMETINDSNNSQYFWINRRDLEIESKRNWQAICDNVKTRRDKNIGKYYHQILHFNLIKYL